MNVIVVTNVELGWDCVVGCRWDIESAIVLANEFHYEDKTLNQQDLSNVGFVFHEREVL